MHVSLSKAANFFFWTGILPLVSFWGSYKEKNWFLTRVLICPSNGRTNRFLDEIQDFMLGRTKKNVEISKKKDISSHSFGTHTFLCFQKQPEKRLLQNKDAWISYKIALHSMYGTLKCKFRAFGRVLHLLGRDGWI